MDETPDGAPRGATVDRVRRSNLQTVLGIVHTRGATSRARLTDTTGLNRSTVGDLAGELVELGLVVESEPLGARRVGRPSPVVAANPAVVAFAVNPEIDAITVARVGLDGRVQARARHENIAIPTATEAAAIASTLIATLRHPGSTVVGVGIAVPGVVRARDGLVRLAPHLGWSDEPFAQLLAAAAGQPTWASNDATLGMRAESVFGAGRGVRDLVFLNGGASGVGGGVLVGGELLGGADGFAGELGHTLVASSGSRCHCGGTGCLETEVGQDALLEVAGLARSSADDLGDALVASDDPLVAAEVVRQVDFLAVTLRNVVNTFNPGMIVLGGFLGALHAAAGGRLLGSVQSGALVGPRSSVAITRAALGRDRLMIGAAQLAFADLLADPAAFVP